MIESEVIKDSANPAGIRLITLRLDYPRFIHQELLTHRSFSRNSASSRAIPTKKLIERIKSNPAMPIQWGKNRPGMQSDEPLDQDAIEHCKREWLGARDKALESVEQMLKHTPHKQTINRLLEPFMHMQVVLTATEWDNFFLLRDHEDAQPEIRQLAIKMRESINDSSPEELKEGEWHLPFIRELDSHLSIEEKLQCSTARCARVSYYLHDGKEPDIEKDISLHDRLVGSVPRHSSPAEHAAIATNDDRQYNNFRGWKQYRWFLDEANSHL